MTLSEKKPNRSFDAEDDYSSHNHELERMGERRGEGRAWTSELSSSGLKLTAGVGRDA